MKYAYMYIYTYLIYMPKTVQFVQKNHKKKIKIKAEGSLVEIFINPKFSSIFAAF